MAASSCSEVKGNRNGSLAWSYSNEFNARVAITERLDGSVVTWMEKVGEEQYRKQ
jgi:hypothetical protein